MSHPIVEELVAGSHILANEGVLDGLGHFSVRHPDNPQRYLMSRSLAPALVTAADIVEYDLDSKLVTAVVFISTLLSPFTLTPLLVFLGK